MAMVLMEEGYERLISTVCGAVTACACPHLHGLAVFHFAEPLRRRTLRQPALLSPKTMQSWASIVAVK